MFHLSVAPLSDNPTIPVRICRGNNRRHMMLLMSSVHSSRAFCRQSQPHPLQLFIVAFPAVPSRSSASSASPVTISHLSSTSSLVLTTARTRLGRSEDLEGVRSSRCGDLRGFEGARASPGHSSASPHCQTHSINKKTK